MTPITREHLMKHSNHSNSRDRLLQHSAFPFSSIASPHLHRSDYDSSNNSDDDDDDDCSQDSTNTLGYYKRPKKNARLVDIAAIERMIPIAANIAAFVWLLLLATTYAIVPAEYWEKLEGAESHVTTGAAVVMIVSAILLLMPILLRYRSSRFSGIVYAGIVIQSIAFTTNFLLATCPTVVMTDPVTKARVFFIRWCEWIPLSGLMTFLSEAVDIPRTGYGVLVPVLVGITQSLSCLCAIIFPLCANEVAWSLVMVFSMVTYMVMFPRAYQKRHDYLRTQKGHTFLQVENYHRRKFGYHLTTTCTVVWTILVVFYTVVALIMNFAPEGHPLRNDSLGMILDTTFDVLAKSIYTKIIIEVHESVFDAEGRARRQLDELRRMMSALWDTSSDVIIISVLQEEKTITMMSPTFPNMVGAKIPSVAAMSDGDDSDDIASVSSLIPPHDSEAAVALIVETEYDAFTKDESTSDKKKKQEKYKRKERLRRKGQMRADTAFTAASEAYFVDSLSIPYAAMHRGKRSGRHATETSNQSILSLDPNARKLMLEQAEKIVVAAWTPPAGSGDPKEALTVHEVETVSGAKLQCEVKVTKQDNNAIIAIVRDVTERYRRFEAEKKAHSETLARQKDAQAVNRFTRHEIKNGLLAGIEMCDFLRGSLQELEKEQQANLAPPELPEEIVARTDQVGVGANNVSALSDAANTTSPRGSNGAIIVNVDSSERRSSLTTQQTSRAKSGMARYINELDNTLHEVLDTVLAEAMARDVIHEVYQPKLDRVDIREALSTSGFTEPKRFPITMYPSFMPQLSMDIQLLRYIHRNAVSNACKYGRKGGVVSTDVRYFATRKELEMDVINEPGENHDELVAMGHIASEAVFSQGTRLHKNSDHLDTISTGDGAWIMQRCARTLGGYCNIRFENHQTCFTFRCPAEQYNLPWQKNEQFEVPAGTWGIAIDDSSIQRRLMGRILMHAGVRSNRLKVLGKTAAEVEGLKDMIMQILDDDKACNLLVLMDENLEYFDTYAKQMSGSKVMESIIKEMPKDYERRCLVLVRSANDSADDIAMYESRTHGFFPKAPTRREHVREILAPIWMNRFSVAVDDCDHSTEPLTSNESDDELVTKEELLRSLTKVENVLEDDDSAWKLLWGALHGLKGDLQVIENNDEADIAIELISSLRGNKKPSTFPETWDRVHEIVTDVASSLQ